MNNPWQNNYLIGHKNVVSNILSSFNADRLSNTILLQGTRGIGKSTFAFNFVKYLFSNSKDKCLDFNEHDINITNISNLEHPDLFYLNSEQNNKSSNLITIDNVKEMQNFILYHPTIAQYKIVIIDAVDDLNRNSANALLKILEEPPKYCIFILINHNAASLLETIKSRCQIFNFKDNSEHEILAIANKNLDITETRLLHKYMMFINNSFGQIKKLMDNNYLDEYENLISNILTILNSDNDITTKYFYDLIKLSENKNIDIPILINSFIYRFNIYSIYKNDEQMFEASHFSNNEQLLFEIMQNKASIDRYIDWLFEFNELFQQNSHLNLDTRLTLWNNIENFIKMR